LLDKNKLIVFFVFFISFTFICEINSVFSSDKEILKFKDSIKLLKEKKFPEAISSLKTISDDNNVKAQHMLSQILYSGNITTQDFEKSYYWANIAKLGGYKKSEKIVELLNDLLDENQKITINKSIKTFLEKKAMEYNKLAIIQIAKWYLTLSEEIDYQNSYKWYNVAVAIGIKTAVNKRDEIINELSPEQIIDAQKSSGEIFEKLTKKGG